MEFINFKIDRSEWRCYYYYCSLINMLMSDIDVDPFDMIERFKKSDELSKLYFLNLYIFNNTNQTSNPYKLKRLFTDICDAYYAFCKQLENNEKRRVRDSVDDYLRHTMEIRPEIRSTRYDDTEIWMMSDLE